jgi:phospholipid/cholesterol/gamma-HCH transport system ATP-binding protein
MGIMEKEKDIIQIKNLTLKSGNEILIRPATLNIKESETFLITGPSGSGKTIFVKCCFGLMEPDSGEVLINGDNIHEVDQEHKQQILKKIGFVFQGGALIQNMNIYDNITLGPQYFGEMPEEEIKKEAEQLLKEFRLTSKKDQRPSQLSLGEIKSVAIARELINKPEIYFFDEPTANVDYQTERKILNIIKKQKKNKKTLIIVSHDIEFAYSIADRIGLLLDGKFIFIGTPEELKNSDSQLIKETVETLSATTQTQPQVS